MTITGPKGWVVGKQVWIAGGAKSGVCAAKALQKLGAHVFLSDSSKISDDIKKSLNELKISYEENSHSTKEFEKSAQLLVTSPGIPQDKGLSFLALQKNIPVVSEIEVGSWIVPPTSKVIGITGTNGKSTVTNYLAQLFECNGTRSIACGNIGRPFSDVAEEAFGFYALELSSYQIETTYTLALDAAILLNIQNDHLSRYKTISEYVKAKWRILSFVKPGGSAFIGHDFLKMGLEFGFPFRQDINFTVIGAIGKTYRKSTALNFPMSAVQPQSMYGGLREIPLASQVHYPNVCFFEIEKTKEGWSFSSHPSPQLSFAIQEACLPGSHNIENLLSASLSAISLGLPLELILRQWEKASSHYKQLPHRLERIGDDATLYMDAAGETKRVAIYNDSKATNVESVLVAIRSFQTPVRLLVGGEPKGDSYKPLLDYLKSPVVAVYPFGNAGARIGAELGAAPGICRPFSNMLDAAEQALTDAQEGDTILLSPACASFDEFKNFEHRGDVFRVWAQAKKRG